MITRFFVFNVCTLLLLTLSVDGQVNLQTGAATFDLSLYSYSDPNNRIGSSVSLFYTAGGGLRASEVPTSVGSGWNINCGGVIERVQIGERDDQKNNDSYAYPSCISTSAELQAYNSWANDYFPNGYLYSEFPASDLTTNGARVEPIISSTCYKFKQKQKYLADKEQDIFMFSFGNNYGFFIISKPVNGIYQIRTLIDSRLKINVVFGDLNNNANIRTTISEFQIIDESGIKYIFRDAGLSELCEYNKTYLYETTGDPVLSNGEVAYQPCAYSVCVSPANACSYSQLQQEVPNLGVIKGEPKNKFFKDKWFLSEIVNPLTGKSIYYQYEDYAYDYEGPTVTSAVQSPAESGNPKTNMSIMTMRIKGIAKRLKKMIVSPTEEVEFEYSANNRVDLSFDKTLNFINVKYNGVTNFRWKFSYGYFVKNTIKGISENFSNEDKKWSRLTLQKVEKIDLQGIAASPYFFDYYMGNEGGINSAIPPIYAFSTDSWGFYNPTVSGFYDPVSQSVSPANAPYEPFGQKILPRTKYYYLTLQQSWTRNPTIEARNGVLKSIKYPTGGTQKFEFEQNIAEGNIPTGGIRVKKIIRSDGENLQNDIVDEYSYNKETGGSSGWGYEPFVYSYNDDSYYFYGNSSETRGGIDFVSLAVGLQNSFNAPHPSVPAYVKFAIREKIAIPKGMNPALAYCIKAAVHAIVEYIISLGNQSSNHFTNINYSSNPFNSDNLLPFQYSRVQVVNKNGNENLGKTVFEFTSVDDYPLEVSNYTFPYSRKKRLAEWQYGLLKRKLIYDKNDLLLKKIINNYNSFKYWLAGNENLSRKWFPRNKVHRAGFINFSLGPCNFPGDDNNDNELYVETYSPLCGHIELSNTNEYTYNGSGQFTVSTIDYSYNSVNYLQNKVRVSNSNGEVVETVSYFPEDYNLSGPVQNLVNNHIINTVVSSETNITKSSGVKYLLKGEVSEFGSVPNGDINVINKYSFRSDQPLIYSAASFNSTLLIPNTTYYKKAATISYGPAGNVNELSTDQGKVATIYENENKLTTATVVNASVANIAYTSFEDNSTGGWTVLPGGNIATDVYITGKKSFSGGLSKSSLQAGNYTVTVWRYKSGNVTVNSQSGNLISTIGDWSLYQWSLSNISSVQVNGSQIDEVRLYPSSSRMSTVTYDPILGKTSECDASNRITYYEYDELGRLKTVMDEKKNVIKAYQYNYRQ